VTTAFATYDHERKIKLAAVEFKDGVDWQKFYHAEAVREQIPMSAASEFTSERKPGVRPPSA